MTSLDILYYALALGFLVFIVFLSYVLYQFGLVLKSLKITFDKLQEVVRGFERIRHGLEVGFLGLITWLIKSLEKGGGKDGLCR